MQNLKFSPHDWWSCKYSEILHRYRRFERTCIIWIWTWKDDPWKCV